MNVIAQVANLVLCIGMVVTTVLPARAELQPNELVVVAAAGDRDSEALAKYYIRMRGLPPENFCSVELPKTEVCPRETWQAKIRPSIAQWLTDHDPQQRIKCLVTVWGVPLKIGPDSPDASVLRYQSFLSAERSHRLKLLSDAVSAFEKIAGSDDVGQSPAPESSLTESPSSARTATASPPAKADAAKSAPPKGSEAKPGNDFSQLQAKLERALQRAQQRVSSLSESQERTLAQLQIQQLATAAGGLNVLLPALSQRLAAATQDKEAVKAEFDVLRGRLAAHSDDRSLLEQMPPGIENSALVLAVVERTVGLIGSVQWLDQQLDVVKKNETGASFDSELSLVMWPDDYQLLRWQPNYFRPGYSNSQLPAFHRTLMVARIDAPTLKLAKGLIDTAIEVEKKGLRGKVYIDARGLAKLDNAQMVGGSYEDFDRSLLITAKGIQEQTDFKVVLESTPRLFQLNECPDAALYCGWYSLGKYIDAFQWVPGAVAYHLASSEAATLRDPASEVWCKKMLEHGVCATVGPVYEPYLAAFPRPDEFFAVLLRGDRTLVECYYLTQPFNSWMMTLIGDPLYRPFKYRVNLPAAAPKPAEKASAAPIPTPPSGSVKPATK